MLSFVDAHFHVWDTSLRRYPWLDAEDCAHLPRTYAGQEWVSDTAGLPLLAAVHVQAEADHELDPLDEVHWVASLPLGTPVVQVAYADLRSPDLGELLDRLAAHPRVRGVRQEAWFDLGSTRADIPDVDLMADPLWRQGLNLLAPRALSFDLLVRGHQLGTAADVLREHPELIVAVDHLGLPGTDPDELALWRTGLRRVADEVPRSFLKLSGWSMFAPAWDSARVPPHLEEALEVFGPERCMLASNWPVEPRRDYHSYWEHLDRATCSLGASERSRLFSETASTCYRIDPACEELT